MKFVIAGLFIFLCAESSCTAARKEFENCVELDIFVFFLFLRTLYKIIKLKATILFFDYKFVS